MGTPRRSEVIPVGTKRTAKSYGFLAQASKRNTLTGETTALSSDARLAYTESVTYGPNFKDYKQRIAEGRPCTTELDGVKYLRYKEVSELDSRWLGKPAATQFDFKEYGTIAGTTFRPLSTANLRGSLVGDARSKAQIAFTKQARKRTQGWAGGVFAGELVEAARLLRNPAKALRRATDELLRDCLMKKQKYGSAAALARKNGRKQLRGVVADTWLTWSFGVKPLWNDAKDAAIAFEKIANGPSKRGSVVVSGWAEASDYRGNIEPGYLRNHISGIPSGVITTTRHDFMARVKIKGALASYNPAGEMPIPIQLGFDLSSVVPTAWELIPWSFLVDYFVNVGDVLDAWSIRFLDWAWVQETVHQEARITTESFRAANSTADRYNSLYVIRTPSGVTSTVSRRPIKPHFRPQLTAKIPDFPSTKWLNMAALAQGIERVKR